MPNQVNVLVGGEAGQGLVTVGELLAGSLARSGYSVLTSQTYESRIRGGHNTFSVRAGAAEVLAPSESADLLVALDGETLRLHSGALSPGALVIADGALEGRPSGALGVPFGELAPARQANVAALGVISGALSLDREVVRKAVEDRFGRKDAEVARQNEEVLRRAYDWFAESGARTLALEGAPRAGRRLLLSGNEAVAFGAVSAGLRFASFYPMTPSTPIAEKLAALAEKLGLVVEQAEDEIAAVNMAIGASFAGAPSMVSTAGGGFALMVEGVSLAAMTETPLVVVVGQRPAPATGLPTRTEQADLEFVLHAGHGEFPRAVFAPGSIEQCFHLTRKAFELAERTQGPAFVLTDHFIADSMRTIEPLDVESLEAVGAPREGIPIEEPYRRYRLVPGGVSPRLLPGRTKHLVVADSDEHDEFGHITADLSLRKLMVEKRLAKGAILREACVPPEYAGDDRPEVLLVAWGSTRGSALEAARILGERGARSAVLHFAQIWPLVPEQFAERLRGAREVVCVESNATGQFARLLRRETGVEIARRVLRYDGLAITPEYILRELGSAARF